MTARLAYVLVALLAASASAWAQDDPPSPPPPPPHAWQSGEPVSMTVAMAGVVVASAGFGLMLRTTEPCNCAPRTAWVVGGVIVVAAGVTLTWLGLRSRTITVSPTLGPHAVGGAVALRWGGHDHARPPDP